MTSQTSSLKSLFLIGAIPAFAGLLVGFNTAVIAGALEFIAGDFSLTTTLKEVVVTSILAGALVGAFLSGPLTDKFGQRKVIQLSGLLSLVCAVGCALAPSFLLLCVSRTILGLGVGIATMVAPLYVAETSPPKWRGAFVSFVQLAITIGIFLSYCVNYLLAGGGGWRTMMGLGALPGFVLIIGMFFLPESPRWLALKGRVEDARNALLQLGFGEEESKLELAAIIPETGKDIGGTGGEPKFTDLFSRQIGPVSLIACGLFLTQNFSGIDGILYYAPEIFKVVGLSGTTGQILATCGLGAINVIATVASTLFIDRAGRRPLLIGGLSVMVASLATLSISMAGSTPAGSPWIAAGCLAVFVWAFAFSLGPIPYVIMSEIFPVRLRGMGMSLAAASAWGCNIIVTSTFLNLLEMIGRSNLFWCYCGICAIGLAFSFFTVPETKNCSLELIEENLKAGVSTRNLGRPRGAAAKDL
jgi:SP family galactose:H+ symporter-like MFS transporter